MRGLERAYGVKTLDEYLTASVARPRFNALLLGIFAGLALISSALERAQ